MKLSSVLYLALMLIGALLPWTLPFHLTNLVHSKFRSRLWSIRDAIVMDIVRDVLEPRDGTKRLLAAIEANIRVTKRHTFTDARLAVAVLRNKPIPSLRDEILDSDIDPTQRLRLSEYLDRYWDACRDHLIWGSPSGWAAYVRYEVREWLAERREHVEWQRRDAEIREQTINIEAKELPKLLRNKKRLDASDPIDLSIPA